jgi:phosphohistidine swiveling domain-containing protein
MITKRAAVRSLGAESLLLPGMIRAALCANDRLKFYMTVLQAAAHRAVAPAAGPADLSREKVAAGVTAPWVDELALTTLLDNARYRSAAFAPLWKALEADLSVMLQPMQHDAALAARFDRWVSWLRALEPDALARESLPLIVGGDRDRGDSLHLLVMDLHRALNGLAAERAEETVDGGHAFGLREEDRPRLRAFMRGVNRTRHLKFDHPGLDTAAVRDAGRLMIQNDIGTNDAHVLVIQVEDGSISLTYSDLHRPRFEFFRELLADLSATWSVVEPQFTPGLNAGEAYFVGSAQFAANDEEALQRTPEAIEAVFASWCRPKAREYRRAHGIADQLGTAVAVQAMVFGNAGGLSGSGVGFTRDPVTGRPEPWVDFLFDVQGEDVVSGRRSAQGHRPLLQAAPALWSELREAAGAMERLFGDMQDFEFTVQQGTLYFLQARSGRRSPSAALRIALDMYDEGLIRREEALARVEAIDPDSLLVSRVAAAGDGPAEELEAVATASSAAGGVACGEIALDENRARQRRSDGAEVILVRRDAETDDLAALQLAAGLLTARGARTSHAAVVARQLEKVCLVGCDSLSIDLPARRIRLGAVDLAEGEVISIDGNQGRVYIGRVRTISERPADLMRRLQRLRASAA